MSMKNRKHAVAHNPCFARDICREQEKIHVSEEDDDDDDDGSFVDTHYATDADCDANYALSLPTKSQSDRGTLRLRSVPSARRYDMASSANACWISSASSPMPSKNRWSGA